jgi:probable HAF family extracellular repeat protein
MNAGGQIVGLYTLSNSVNYHAVLWNQKGEMTDLGTLGGLNSSAKAISGSGVVVGYSYLSNGDVHAFRWSSADGMVDLGTLGGDNSSALGVSGTGEALGAATAQPNQLDQGCIWMQDGEIESLGLGTGSEIWAANATGDLVGAFGGNYNRALVWTPAHHGQDLNQLIPPNSGWVLHAAYAINKSGQIVTAGVINGQTHSALLTPSN